MTLPASGAISLNEMHIEAGGTTSTAATINDTDIRALIGKTSATAMNFAEWYGASAYITLTGASLSTSFVNGFDISTPSTVTSSSVTCSPVPSGASGTLTYLWSHVSGSVFTITSSTSASTTFSKFFFTDGNETGAYRCRIIQDGTTTVYSGNVTVNLEAGVL